jgi:hypothetical protein
MYTWSNNPKVTRYWNVCNCLIARNIRGPYVDIFVICVTNLPLPFANIASLIAIKMKEKDFFSRPPCCSLTFYTNITLIKVQYSALYGYFHSHPPPQIRAHAILLFLIVLNYNSRFWDSLKCHYVCGKVYLYSSENFKNGSGGVTNTETMMIPKAGSILILISYVTVFYYKNLWRLSVALPFSIVV